MQSEKRKADVRSQTIVLSPEKASDFEGELPALADDLTDELPDVTVEIRDPLRSPPGAFIPPEAVHVLSVIFPYAAGYSFDKAADLITGRLRATLKKDGDESPVRIVKIYGPGGEILKRIKISAEDSETEAD
jgi:hypothetical protein